MKKEDQLTYLRNMLKATCEKRLGVEIDRRISITVSLMGKSQKALDAQSNIERAIQAIDVKIDRIKGVIADVESGKFDIDKKSALDI